MSSIRFPNQNGNDIYFNISYIRPAPGGVHGSHLTYEAGLRMDLWKYISLGGKKFFEVSFYKQPKNSAVTCGRLISSFFFQIL